MSQVQGAIGSGPAAAPAKTGRTLNVAQLRKIQAAIKPKGQDGMLRLVERLAVAMIPLGASLILLGWFGAANSILVQEQIPYMISGGMLGTALLVGGGMLYLGAWVAKLAGQNREQSEALRNQLEGLREDVRSLRSSGGVAWPSDAAAAGGAALAAVPSLGALVATPKGSMYHLTSCGVVAGRTDLRDIGEDDQAGMKPCGMCEPQAI